MTSIENKLTPEHRVVILLASDELAVRFLKRMDVDSQVIFATDLSDWSKAIKNHFGAIGFLEATSNFGDDEMSSRIQAVRECVRHTSAATIFAVGTKELRRFEPELLISGFAGVFCSISEAIRCRVICGLHWRFLEWPTCDLETMIERNLPWNSTPNLTNEEYI